LLTLVIVNVIGAVELQSIFTLLGNILNVGLVILFTHDSFLNPLLASYLA
jgi:hypothetical protein